jgi:hypothetical protein
MKRKITIFIGLLLTIIVLAITVVPVYASDDPGITASTIQNDQGCNKIKILGHLLLIQDEAKIDAIIDRAVDVGKLTDQQSIELKDFWTTYHEQFTKKAALIRILRANDGAKVQAFLDRCVTAGKINAEQAGKIMTLWEKLHSH